MIVALISFQTLMFLFSGLWPYLKLFITMVLWFLLPSRVGMKTRGRIFLWLDALAKWSMIDVFIMVLVFVGFRVSIRRYVYTGS
jgi:uncharacterized paraquat-inducible protein A